MTFSDHFSAVAKGYAAFRPHYPPELADVLADRAPAGTAWDVGCGTGQLSVQLARRFARVIATDPAEAQLAQATAAARVEYRCAPAEASGLPDASCALVVAAQAAHWFDWPRFVAEAARVAVPGALIALVSYGIEVIDEPACDARVARYYHDDAGPFWPPGREHVENGYRDLVLPWPAVDAGTPLAMRVTWTRQELLGYVSTWSATTRMIAAKGRDALGALEEELRSIWPDGVNREIRWPLTVKLARV